MRAHTHSQTQTHIGTATQIAFASPKRKPLLGLLEVAGREEEIQYRSLAWCHALCCIQWLQLAAAAAVCAACIPPTLARVASCTLVLWIRACWCCSHCSCLVAAAGGGSGGCCADSLIPLSSASEQGHLGCCPLLLPLVCASLCTVAVSLCGILSMLLLCCVVCACCVLERGKRERESDPNTKQSKEERIEKGKKAVPKWKARRRTHKRGFAIPSIVASLFFQSNTANTQQEEGEEGTQVGGRPEGR